MAIPLRIKRGLRSALTSLQSATGILVGELYYISDEQRIAVGTSTSATSSMATKAEVDAKANAADAVLTGNPTAPTQTAGNDSTRIATTAFIQAAITALGLKTGSQRAIHVGTTAPGSPAEGDIWIDTN